MASVWDTDKPLRFACDRCHSQKLRCPRSNETDSDEPCSRCRKAGVQCIVSLRGKVGRPAKVSKTVTTPAKSLPSKNHSRRASGASTSTTSKKMTKSLSSETHLVDLPHLNPTGVVMSPHNNPAAAALLSMSCTDDASHLLVNPSHVFMSPTEDDRLPLSQFLDPALSHTSSTSTTDNEDIDSEAHTWSSLSHSSSTTPGIVDTTLYDQISMDLDMTSCLPAFYFPHEASKVPTLDTIIPTLPGDVYALNTTSSKPFSSPKSNSLTGLQPQRRTGSPPGVDSKPSRPTWLNNLDEMPSAAFTSDDSVSTFSSTACFRALSELNLRILRSSEGCHSPTTSPGVRGNKILRDTVQFCGEFIQTARHSMPRILSNKGLSPPPLDDIYHDMSLFSTPGQQHTTWDAYPTGGGGTESPCRDRVQAQAQQAADMPESAIIFLLLGCYTQILHSFEVAIKCLFSEHYDKADLSETGKTHSSSTIQSLLEASLAIHTITYLLNRIHQALASFNAEHDGDVIMQQDDPRYIENWKRPFTGSVLIDEGLLGRALQEINERERSLTRKAQELKLIINKSHI